MKKSEAGQSQLRIIAGRWRGRKISFPTNLSIRPSPDRVRETVFNWLAPYIMNSRCLDLYAGSGALGFEALSRGSSSLVFVDIEQAIINTFEIHHQTLKIESEIGENAVTYVKSDAQAYLSTLDDTKFDLIFLDPPYQQDMIPAIINIIDSKELVNSDGIIYIEMAKSETFPEVPANWKLIKNKVMSQVACYLIQVTK